ncbi:protein PFC0760c [Galendromus occidentalis]|uniref:Protein PFC0760c n=1 Tax=Galendromus occidentalis TaxID=34638 RepID=A0AAJ6QPE7_9ACAR|nr:protein PFC0760c [Galendromus occidentalis]
MRVLTTGSLLLVVFLLVSVVQAQDDDDGDGAYGADDGGDDGYDAPADDGGDDGDDSPADGDDDFGGDESRPQPEYVSTIERDDDSLEGDASNKVEVRVAPHRRMRRSLDPIVNRMRRSSNGGGVVGPVHTYVRTDYDGNYRWGARHHVGSSYGRGK